MSFSTGIPIRAPRKGLTARRGSVIYFEKNHQMTPPNNARPNNIFKMKPPILTATKSTKQPAASMATWTTGEAMLVEIEPMRAIIRIQ
jgi:hypothetical protein